MEYEIPSLRRCVAWRQDVCWDLQEEKVDTRRLSFCTVGMCLPFKTINTSNVSKLARPCTGVFNLSHVNVFLIKRDVDTWISITIRFFFLEGEVSLWDFKF